MNFQTAVIYGSVREKRQGIKGAYFIMNQLRARGIEANLIDAKEYELPLLDKMYKEYEKGQAPEPMEYVANQLNKADGFIVVCGEYNHSIPPALKNLLDHFQKEYFFKPSAIASYSVGAFGGLRAAVHLRAVLGELGTPSIPSIFPMPRVHASFDDQGNVLEGKFDEWINKFLDEFIWYVKAFKAARENGTPH